VSRHNACHLHKEAVESISESILLRRVRNRGFVLRDVLVAKHVECRRYVLRNFHGSTYAVR